MAPENVSASLSRDYLIMAYVCSLGVIQIAATIGGFKGLYLIPDFRRARVLGILLVITGLAYFFTAPLWITGPWGQEMISGGHSGAEGLSVEWDKSSWADLPRARNINDIDGGLSGTTQALWFPTGVAAGLFSTLILTSIINHGLIGRMTDPNNGMGALASMSWWRALRSSLGLWNKAWRNEMSGQFDEDREWAWFRNFVNRWRGI